MRFASFRKTGKRISAVVLAVMILFLTPACDYLDAKHMETVDAASIVAGVTAASVLKLTAAALGVVIATGATAKAVDSFDQWVHSEGTQEVIENWEQAQAEVTEYQISHGLAASVRSWLLSKFGSLDSGDVTVSYGDGVITNGVPALYPEVEQSFLRNCSSAYLDGRDFYYFNGYYKLDSSLVYTFFSSEPHREDYNTYLIFTNVGPSFLRAKKDSNVFSAFFPVQRFYTYNYETLATSDRSASGQGIVSALVGKTSFDGMVHSDDTTYYSGPHRIVTNMPVIVTDLDTFVSTGASLSDVLAHATATYNLDTSDTLATSFGSYKESNFSNLVDLKLNASSISRINAAVDQAVADGTSTDEDGNPVYAPDLSAAIIDAYEKGLSDAAGGTLPVDPDKPSDPDKPVVTPDDGILGFLQGLKSSLESWITAIPDAIASGGGVIMDALEAGWETLWGYLSGIVLTLSMIPEILTDGFSSIMQGIMDFPNTLRELFGGLKEWIADIPAILDGAFLNLQEWIMDIPISISDAVDRIQTTILEGIHAIPDADSITRPIVDTLTDVFMIDKDTIKDVIEEEKNSVWNIPYLHDIRDIFEALRFPEEYEYPKIKITTPDILRPYYDHPEIVLLDFADYKDYCLWARLLLRASIWLAFLYHILYVATPKFQIS